ncbi:MAG: multidrug transporter AcrB [Bdellovibrionales bacterium GWA2_49_15]|nr:MAG: multidrug transporter AcrB [Bdellovibrionales bacterium GWA2_49_15]HAZ14900.1 AcrB/AcrD/AcrF family protein [Bdellovibrionales bacterium]
MKPPKIIKGFAGKLAETFVQSKLTPVTIVVALLLGLGSVYLTPKEEEPQITVPMIDVMIPAPGMEARDIERNISEPVERALWGLDGVEYIYSMSRPHGSLVTVRFKVNEPIEPSLVKVHHKLMSLMGELPPNVQRPEVKSYSIDDVPFLAVTFTSKARNDFELRKLVAPLARQLSSTPDLGKVELLGGVRRAIRIIASADKMARSSVTLVDLETALKMNHALLPAGKNWSEEKVLDVEVGGKLSSIQEISQLPIGSRGGRVVKVGDVAQVVDGPEERTRLSVLYSKDEKIEGAQAVTISFSKRKGTNVVDLAETILSRLDASKKDLPADVQLTIVRDYGASAKEKSHELIQHLIMATFSVTLLIALAMGVRAAIVVAIAIPVTLALTLAVYYFMGYTLNRVTLFALIFSIGILVDDAIVVVENIERYLKTYKKLTIIQATLRAVSEVGNPTILATITVIAAILPMAFVRGLMGPYMRPIPVGASLAMILSLFVAFIVTPWASVKLLKHSESHGESATPEHSRLDRLYIWLSDHLLSHKKWSMLFTLLVVALFLASTSMVGTKAVKVKMLPFDNKSEFQITLDYPVMTPLMISSQWSQELALSLLKHPDVKKVQIFTGEAAPFSFSGMVKHTFLRKSEFMSDLHVILADKGERKKSGHEIINELRPVVHEFSQAKGAISKVLEIPPGPPVMATMVAEIYGGDAASRRKAGSEIHQLFASESSIVDLDYSWRESRARMIIPYDYKKAATYGTKAVQSWSLGQLIFSESKVATLDDITTPEEVGVVLSLDQNTRSGVNPFKGQTFPSFEAGVVGAGNVLGQTQILKTETLYRKNLRPVEYVLSELAGSEEAPVYGILKLGPQISYPTQTAEVPWNNHETIIKWDGEWFITYEVFRDLGAAFLVVMILIYILVVGWFKSFLVPFVIMAPIPISLIGIIPGHYLTGAYFTATSMIGFIAGAGIIVRNSIILVDFIEHQIKNGYALKEAVISAGVLRFRPMLLTAAAVVVGSSVMLFDPIFQGLAVSLIFGEIAATLLSRFAVPLGYYWLIGNRRHAELTRPAVENNNWGADDEN